MAENIMRLSQFVQQGFDQGRERQKQSKLAQLASQAYGADPNAQRGMVQQAIGVSPDAGFALGGNLQKGRQDDFKELGQAAAMFSSIPPEQKAQFYAQNIAPLAHRAGYPVPTQYNPQFDGLMEKLAASIGGAGESYTLSPGSQRFGPNNQKVAEVPFAPAKPQGATFQVDAQGNGWWLTPGQAPQPADMPQQGPTGGAATTLNQAYQGAADPQAIQTDFRSLAQQFPGTQISSLQRTPEHNAKVGGVANSQHIAGTAGDFVVPQAEKAAFIAGAKQHGYEAIDEGDHIHLELPPNRQHAQSAGRIQFKSPQTNVPSGYRPTANGGLEPIPGGPAQIALEAKRSAAAAKQAAEDAKAEQKRQVAAARQAEAATAANNLVGAIDQLMSAPGYANLGTASGDVMIATPMIRNDAKDANAQLQNIAGQVALSTMARLKALSSQGATGFGALSGPELKLLQNAIATLQSSDISNAQLSRSLKTIRDTVSKVSEWKPEDAHTAIPQATQSGGNFSHLWGN